MFQEFPKALYQSDDVYRIAANAEEEAQLRADGFMDHADLNGNQYAAPDTARRTRGPNKAK